MLRDVIEPWELHLREARDSVTLVTVCSAHFYHFKFFSLAHHKPLKRIIDDYSPYFSSEPDDLDQELRVPFEKLSF